MAKKKTAKRLEREIASSLAARGEPTLAAIFADPEAQAAFARELRHELQKKQIAASSAAFMAARPYTVKERVGDRGVLFGRHATEDAARAAADKIGGWIEYEGHVIYEAPRR